MTRYLGKLNMSILWAGMLLIILGMAVVLTGKSEHGVAICGLGLVLILCFVFTTKGKYVYR